MRDFTQEDYEKLQKNLKAMDNTPTHFKDYTLKKVIIRTIPKPTVTVVVPDDSESLEYAKKIWNFLLLDLYTVKYAKNISNDDSVTNDLNYDLIFEETALNNEKLFILINKSK